MQSQERFELQWKSYHLTSTEATLIPPLPLFRAEASFILELKVFCNAYGAKWMYLLAQWISNESWDLPQPQQQEMYPPPPAERGHCMAKVTNEEQHPPHSHIPLLQYSEFRVQRSHLRQCVHSILVESHSWPLNAQVTAAARSNKPFRLASLTHWAMISLRGRDGRIATGCVGEWQGVAQWVITCCRSRRRGPGCPGWCPGKCGGGRSGWAPGCPSAHPEEVRPITQTLRILND